MLIQQLNRTDPEKVAICIKNVEATSITMGMAVAYCIGTAASFDGVNAVKPASGTAANLPGFIGVALQDIASNGFGLVQMFGSVASVLLSNVATSVTIASGDPLIPSPLGGFFSSGAPTYAASGFGWVIASAVPANTLSVAAPLYCSGVVRALK